ncbi:hypothetical protein [Nocardia sp. NPDC046763]|uniref:hypothetical protein n=1 Tax=Nocardia sp. NPDC046763 TaxID=3155256 RepID=UPI0033D41FEC
MSSVVRTIPDAPDVHGVLVVPGKHRVYATVTGRDQGVALAEDSGAVAQNLGIVVLPAPETPHPGLTRVPLTGERERSIGLVSGNHRPTPAVARLRDHVAAHAMSHLEHAREAVVRSRWESDFPG